MKEVPLACVNRTRKDEAVTHPGRWLNVACPIRESSSGSDTVRAHLTHESQHSVGIREYNEIIPLRLTIKSSPRPAVSAITGAISNKNDSC
jgi:hypothetical protein